MVRYKINIKTIVHRQSTNNNTYLNWKSYSSNKWKLWILRALVIKAYDMCSTSL